MIVEIFSRFTKTFSNRDNDIISIECKIHTLLLDRDLCSRYLCIKPWNMHLILNFKKKKKERQLRLNIFF